MAIRTLPEGLLDAVKNFLDITWRDEAGDTKLSGILLRGMAYLDRRAGRALDYSEGTETRALLFEYSRYVRAGALQDFGEDFLSELMELGMQGEVEAYDAEQL